MEITNKGEQPKAEIIESGGLKNLRHTVESAGGVMTVKSKPRFGLVIKFEGEKQNVQNKSYDC